MSLIIKYNLFQFTLFVYLKCYYYVQGRSFTRFYFLIIVFVILNSWQYICTKVQCMVFGRWRRSGWAY